MRTDMHKVVVERERGRSTWKNRKWARGFHSFPMLRTNSKSCPLN